VPEGRDHQNLYYRWSKEFLEAGKKRLAGDTGPRSDQRRDTGVAAQLPIGRASTVSLAGARILARRSKRRGIPPGIPRHSPQGGRISYSHLPTYIKESVAHRVHRLWGWFKNPACGLVDNASKDF